MTFFFVFISSCMASERVMVLTLMTVHLPDDVVLVREHY